MAVSITDIDEIKVPIKPHFAGGYRLEYDSKYITLFGKDKRYPGFNFSEDDDDWFEEMVLVACVEEVRNAQPHIVNIDNEFIYIKLTGGW